MGADGGIVLYRLTDLSKEERELVHELRDSMTYEHTIGGVDYLSVYYGDNLAYSTPLMDQINDYVNKKGSLDASTEAYLKYRFTIAQRKALYKLVLKLKNTCREGYYEAWT